MYILRSAADAVIKKQLDYLSVHIFDLPLGSCCYGL